MKKKDVFRKISTQANVLRRIRYFKEMYPVRSIAADLVLFPRDYYFGRRPIRTVRNVTVAITNVCNIRCAMCYFSNALLKAEKLPYQLFQKLIDEISFSRPCVILSGGEPFTHPDLMRMVEYTKGKKLPVQIFTNGTLVTPEFTERLTGLGLNYINFTLLGTPEIHDRIARVTGTYERFEKNLSFFAGHRKKTKVILNYTITPENIGMIDYPLELAAALKLDGIRLQHYNCLRAEELKCHTGVMKRIFDLSSETNETVNDADLGEFRGHLIDAVKRISHAHKGIAVQWAPTLSRDEIEEWYGGKSFMSDRKCLFPWRGIVVGADGKVYPCSKIYMELGDINKESLVSIWNNAVMDRFRDNLKKGLFPACARCCKL